MRLRKIYPEYAGRVNVRVRPFPLEIYGGEPAPRDILEQEWWLAAMQEPDASFKPFQGDWPTTTIPAFRAAWSVSQIAPEAVHDFDLRIRRAFFAEGRNIGTRDTMLDLARDAEIDLPTFEHLYDSDDSSFAIVEEGKLGKERFRVRGTPTIMLYDGTRLRLPIAFPHLRQRKIVSVDPLPCHAEGCLEATRALFEEALEHAAPAPELR